MTQAQIEQRIARGAPRVVRTSRVRALTLYPFTAAASAAMYRMLPAYRDLHPRARAVLAPVDAGDIWDDLGGLFGGDGTPPIYNPGDPNAPVSGDPLIPDPLLQGTPIGNLGDTSDNPGAFGNVFDTPPTGKDPGGTWSTASGQIPDTNWTPGVDPGVVPPLGGASGGVNNGGGAPPPDTAVYLQATTMLANWNRYMTLKGQVVCDPSDFGATSADLVPTATARSTRAVKAYQVWAVAGGDKAVSHTDGYLDAGTYTSLLATNAKILQDKGAPTTASATPAGPLGLTKGEMIAGAVGVVALAGLVYALK